MCIDRGITAESPNGGGHIGLKTTNQPRKDTGCQMILEEHRDGSCHIRSVRFNNVYLRADAPELTQKLAFGGGTVNCQYGTPDEKERWTIIDMGNGAVAFESCAFPGCFLRAAPVIQGFNLQFGHAEWEAFIIHICAG
jgi:hypothetical protein